jgi:predicted Zn finger-like uncharacterized protein
MTDSFVTQCPHCQTSFRVSHAQLSVARGVVRCGACLQVFNAVKQLLEQRSAKPPADAQTTLPALPVILPVPVAAPVATPIEVPVEVPVVSLKQWKASAIDLDSLDLDNLDLDQELARLEQREIQLPEAFGREGHARHDDSALSAVRDSAETENAQWVDSLLNDDAKEHHHAGADDAPEANEAPETTAHPSRTEPSLSFDTTALDDESEAHAPRLSESQAPPLHTESAKGWSAIDDDEPEPIDDPQERHEPKLKRSRSEPGLHDQGLRDQPLLDLTDDPLQLDWQKPKPRWGRRFFWGLLIVLAAAALVGQYIWYHFDELARQDQYRPWFQQICPQIGCTVPSKVDINLLKSSNLVVRSHPDFKGALVVDAIIYNRAPFSQPFPLLELRFADPNGQLIASRRFKPSEYLSGEMAGKAEMPPQTPIHIALDILDPGTKAVNYSLSFRSPE